MTFKIRYVYKAVVYVSPKIAFIPISTALGWYQLTGYHCYGLDQLLWFCLPLQDAFSNNRQESLKKKIRVYDLWVQEIAWYSWREFVRKEREKESMNLAFCFYWGGRWGPRVSECSLFIDDFKTWVAL